MESKARAFGQGELLIRRLRKVGGTEDAAAARSGRAITINIGWEEPMASRSGRLVRLCQQKLQATSESDDSRRTLSHDMNGCPFISREG